MLEVLGSNFVSGKKLMMEFLMGKHGNYFGKMFSHLPGFCMLQEKIS
jgi:hypothetical protein